MNNETNINNRTVSPEVTHDGYEVVAIYPEGRWLYNDGKYFLEFNYEEIIYETTNVFFFGDLGFVIPFNIGEHDYSSGGADIKLGEGNSTIVHYKNAVSILPGTPVDSIVVSTENFFIYAKDNGMSYSLAIYDPETGSCNDTYYTSERMEILDDRHIMSYKNEVYSLISAEKAHPEDENSPNVYTVDPISMDPFKIEGDYLMTLKGDHVIRVLNK